MSPLIDYVVDSINAPSTTGTPIPQAILRANALGAAYRYGNAWPVYGPYCQARPDLAKKGWIVSATMTWDVPVGTCRLYDVEPGGGSNANVGKFLVRAEKTWGKPILYTFASNVSAMISAAANQGWGRNDYYVYAAHPDSGYGKHICGPGVCPYPKADATQYTFQTPGNCDTGIFESYVFPGGDIPPLPHGEEAMAIAVHVNENNNTEVFVEAQPAGPGKCGQVFNLWKERDSAGASTGWNKDSNGNPDWKSLGTPS